MHRTTHSTRESRRSTLIIAKERDLAGPGGLQHPGVGARTISSTNVRGGWTATRRAASATASGRSIRLRSGRPGIPSQNGVSTAPGQSAATRTPRVRTPPRAHEPARGPAFDAVYAAQPRIARAAEPINCLLVSESSAVPCASTKPTARAIDSGAWTVSASVKQSQCPRATAMPEVSAKPLPVHPDGGPSTREAPGHVGRGGRRRRGWPVSGQSRHRRQLRSRDWGRSAQTGTRDTRPRRAPRSWQGRAR